MTEPLAGGAAAPLSMYAVATLTSAVVKAALEQLSAILAAENPNWRV